MYYVLNKVLRFTPRTNELSIVNDYSNNILLSNSSTRLLSELIKNSNKINHRENLIKTVWEDYGYSPSNNNLYIALSEIRKSIVNLGIEPDFIITVPKQGIKLTADIDIFEMFNYRNVNNNSNNSFINNTESEFPKIVKPKIFGSGNEMVINLSLIKKFSFFIILTTLLSVSLIYLFIFLSSSINQSPIQDLSYDLSFQYDKCNIYLTNTDQNNRFDMVKNKIVNDLKLNKIDCGFEPKNIYYQKNFLRSNIINEYIIGVCNVRKKQNYCQTIKLLAG